MPNHKAVVEEHPFAQYVRILGKGKKGSRSLSFDEAADAMRMMLDGEVEQCQLGAFLMLLRVKEETAEELAGFVAAAKSTLPTSSLPTPDLDWSTYAGKRRQPPWFILAIAALACRGYSILLHGITGNADDRLYSEEVLQRFGIATSTNWQHCQQALEQKNLAYVRLDLISPTLARLIELRPLLGLRSPVHSLARLINPLNANHVIQGIFHPPYLELHLEAARLLGYESTSVIKGEAGEAEVNPDKALTIAASVEGENSRQTWPAYFPKRHIRPERAEFGKLQALWFSEETDEYGEAAVVSTIALALQTMRKSDGYDESMRLAHEIWQERDVDYLSSSTEAPA